MRLFWRQNEWKYYLNIGATTVPGGYPPIILGWADQQCNYSAKHLAIWLPGVYVLSVSRQIGMFHNIQQANVGFQKQY